MTTYTATFRTADTWATQEIKAATPEQALRKARTLAQRDANALDWCIYDPSSVPLEEIEIDGPDGSSAVWQSEDLSLRLAASDMLDALQQAVQSLNTAPRFPVPCLLSDSYKIAAICDRAIAKAKFGAS